MSISPGTDTENHPQGVPLERTKQPIKQPFNDIHDNSGDTVRFCQVRVYHTDLAVTKLCMAVNSQVM